MLQECSETHRSYVHVPPVITWRARCDSRYAPPRRSIFNLSTHNHSLMLFVHIAKTAGSTITQTLARYRAKLHDVPCVSPNQLSCDRTDAWRERHLFLEFHDGRRIFGPQVLPLLDALRERYQRSGGRVLLWTTMRPVIPRTFSHFYMWSSAVINDGHRFRKTKVQLTFDQWARRGNLNTHVVGSGIPFDTARCSDAALRMLIGTFDLVVHMECTTDFLRTLLKSLTGHSTRVGWVTPGNRKSDPNRTRYNWHTIGPCARLHLLNRTWCDARLYSMLFKDDRLHRASWWDDIGS
jgi:hypothetical protein